MVNFKDLCIGHYVHGNAPYIYVLVLQQGFVTLPRVGKRDWLLSGVISLSSFQILSLSNLFSFFCNLYIYIQLICTSIMCLVRWKFKETSNQLFHYAILARWLDIYQFSLVTLINSLFFMLSLLSTIYILEIDKLRQLLEFHPNILVFF